jgi:hypothetical protein
MNNQGQAGETGGQNTNQNNSAPEMTVFEFEGEKIMVPANVAQKLQSGVMARADYDRKNQARSEEKRALEEELQVAREFNRILEDNPELVDVVEALTTGDRQKAKQLLEAENSGDTDSQLNRRLDKLERQLQIQSSNAARQNTTQAYLADLKSRYPDFTEFENEIKRTMSEAQKNPILPVYLAATLPKKIEEARQSGIKEGMKKALEDYDKRFAESPPMGGAGGGDNQGKDVRSAARRALSRLQNEE